MSKRLHTAGQGLTLIYYSHMLVLISSICLAFVTLWQPLEWISSLLTTCGLIFSLTGLAITSKTHKNFKIALGCTLINIVLSLSAVFFVDQHTILASCANILIVVTTIFVILGAQNLCQSKAVKIKGFGKFVMWVYLLIFLLVACANVVFALGIFELRLASIATSIITFIGNFCYIHFLNRARKVLK